MLSKEEYIDIIETLDFFYGDNLIPTAELRKKKSKELQEKDLENFKQKINCLKQLINEHFELKEQIKNGTLSDGYHTFNELYDHRAILFSIICNQNKAIAWKSKKHDDGTMFDGMFIVGIKTPLGQYTYHYDIKPYWEMFDVEELENAPKWDGHQPKDIDRLFSINDNPPL